MLCTAKNEKHEPWKSSHRQAATPEIPFSFSFLVKFLISVIAAIKESSCFHN
jgi:hypothetical protein